jgi:hypothetical protein
MKPCSRAGGNSFPASPSSPCGVWRGVRGAQLQTIRALQSCTVIAVRRVIDGQGWAEIEERARSQAEYERPVRRDEALFVYF